MTTFFRAASTIALVVLVSACAGTNNSAQNGGYDTTGKMVAVTEVRDPNQVTCKTVVKTGTRIGSKVCKSNSDWDKSRRDGREAAESIQRTSTHTAGIKGG